VTLYEGKYHQIRRMFSGTTNRLLASCWLPRPHDAVLRAHLTQLLANDHHSSLDSLAIGNGVPRSIARISIGPLQLGNLEVRSRLEFFEANS